MTPDPFVVYKSPDLQFGFDLNANRLFTRNDDNYINRLGRNNLNTLGNVSMLDIYLSQGHVVEPHYHQNAAELVYCIAGKARVTLINPFTNELTNVEVTPGQVANIPQGWWHWEIALEDGTHLLAIFDAPYPEYIFGSDLLTKTPIEVLAHTYCLDPELLKQTLKPLNNETIIIGPTDECLMHAQAQQHTEQAQQQPQQQQQQQQMQQMQQMQMPSTQPVYPHAQRYTQEPSAYGYYPQPRNPMGWGRR